MKLCAFDVIAANGKYHAKCLAALYNRMRSVECDIIKSADTHEARMHGIAFAQLAAYIDDVKQDSVIVPVFKLSKLAELYMQRLTQLGVVLSNRLNTTRLKDRLLSHLPDMRAQQCGKNVLLAFDEHIGGALSAACQQSFDEDAVHLAKAAEILRRDIHIKSFIHIFRYISRRLSGSFCTK